MLAGVDNLRASPTAVAVDRAALPPELHGWKQIDYQPVVRDRLHQEGEFSRQWTYRAPWGRVQAAFDFPFEGPHLLPRCYLATGWTPSVQTIAPAADRVFANNGSDSLDGGLPDSSNNDGQVADHLLAQGPTNSSRGFQEVALKRQEFEVGSLIYSLWEEDGTLMAPWDSKLSLLKDRVQQAVTTFGSPTPTTYQFQVFVTGEFPLGETEQAELLQFFLEARDHLRQKFTAN